MLDLHTRIPLELIFEPNEYMDMEWEEWISDDMPDLFTFHTYAIIPVNLYNTPIL